MASAKEMLMDIIEPTVERQYGGGLDDAYMTLSQRRDSAFADPNANSAFASPMSMGGLPTIYRQNAGDLNWMDQEDMDAGAASIDPDTQFDEEGNLLPEDQWLYGGYGTRTSDGSARATTKFGKEVTGGEYVSMDKKGRPDTFTDFNKINIARAMQANPQAYADKLNQGIITGKLDEDRNNRQLMQDAIDAGYLQKSGITLANQLENMGLATFGKGMRGPFESSTPGGALYRYADDKRSEEIEDSDKRGVYGEVGFEDSSPESKEFEMRMRYAKPGETVQDIAKQMFDETKMVAPTQNYGYSSNSSAQATQVWDALNDARGAGMIQGLGLLAMGAASPQTLMSTIGSQYDNGETRSILGQIGKTIGDKTGLTSLVGDSKIADRLKTAVDLAERGPGIFTIEPLSRRSVLDSDFDSTKKLIADTERIPEEGEKINVDKANKQLEEAFKLQNISKPISKEDSKQKPTSFVNKILNFFKSSGSPVTPNQDDLGASNDAVERRRVAQPTQKEVAAVAKEAAKIPEEVQKTITSAGLLPQYLALIRAGYTAERAITAIGLPAGTAIA